MPLGFSKLFKPSGKAFESASEGRLLMLAPAAWPYQPGEKKMTRFDACTLNRIAQLIAGEGAAGAATCGGGTGLTPAQQYKGKVPVNIDELVRAATAASGSVGAASAGL